LFGLRFTRGTISGLLFKKKAPHTRVVAAMAITRSGAVDDSAGFRDKFEQPKRGRRSASRRRCCRIFCGIRSVTITRWYQQAGPPAQMRQPFSAVVPASNGTQHKPAFRQVRQELAGVGFGEVSRGR